jgi:hypothetical protein
MQLEFESGRIVRNATPEHVYQYLDGEVFAILSVSAGTYMQCARQHEAPRQYDLEYQEATTDHHYHAVEGPISLEQVHSAFCKYLRGDDSWKTDFHWEQMRL